MPQFPPLPNGDNEDLTLRVITRIKLDHLSKAFKIVSDIELVLNNENYYYYYSHCAPDSVT